MRNDDVAIIAPVRRIISNKAADLASRCLRIAATRDFNLGNNQTGGELLAVADALELGDVIIIGNGGEPTR